MANRFRHQRRRATAAVVVLAVMAAAGGTAACSPSTDQTADLTTESTGPKPALTAEISQFRDNYSNQIIELQLSNSSAGTVTVHAAEVSSPLFTAPITWKSTQLGTAIPPGQTKSLPAQLPAAACREKTGASAATATASGPELRVGLSPAGRKDTVAVLDPYGVLPRNNTEMCVAQTASSIAELRLLPALEVLHGGTTALVHLSVRPLPDAAAGQEADPGSLTINSIDGTTLVAEVPDRPWPRNVVVARGGQGVELRLQIRPARCDPHAVAEDKVGTLLPLRVTVGGTQGVLKIAAGSALKGAIHDFVTAVCAPH